MQRLYLSIQCLVKTFSWWLWLLSWTWNYGLIIPHLGIFLNVFYWNASQTELERTKGNRKIQGSQCGRPWRRALVKRIRSFAQVLNVDFFCKENDFTLEITMGTRYQKVNSTRKAFTLLNTPSLAGDFRRCHIQFSTHWELLCQ